MDETEKNKNKGEVNSNADNVCLHNSRYDLTRI